MLKSRKCPNVESCVGQATRMFTFFHFGGTKVNIFWNRNYIAFLPFFISLFVGIPIRIPINHLVQTVELESCER